MSEVSLYELLAKEKIETWLREAAHRRDVRLATAPRTDPSRVPGARPGPRRTVWPLYWAQRGAELVLSLRIW